jgi:hypothetical protein
MLSGCHANHCFEKSGFSTNSALKSPNSLNHAPKLTLRQMNFSFEPCVDAMECNGTVAA